MRGFGAGMIWGGVVGVCGLGLASLMAPLPAPDVAAVTVPAGSEFARPRPETRPVLPQVSPAPASATAPHVPAPQPASTPPLADTSLPVPSPPPVAAALPSPAAPQADGAAALPGDPPGPVATRGTTGLTAPQMDAPPVEP